MKENNLEYLMDFKGVFPDELEVKLIAAPKGVGGAKPVYTGTIGGMFTYIEKNGNLGNFSTKIRVLDCKQSDDGLAVLILGKEED